LHRPDVIAVAVLAVVVFAGCGSAPSTKWVAAAKKAPLVAGEGEEVVTASGLAEGDGPEDLWRASVTARRRAVASVLARIVPDDPHDPRTTAVRKHVLGHWADYVRPGVRVVSRADSDGAMTVTLRVVVMSDTLAADAARLRTDLDPARKPRIVVAVLPVFADGPVAPARAVERAVAEAFASRGFRHVPGPEPEARRAIEAAVRSSDTQALARAARSAGAEIALVGLAARTLETEGEAFGRKVTTYTPAVTLKAVHSASGNVIFSREHSGEESVGPAALTNAANALAEECLDAVLRERRSSAPAFAAATVSVEGISFEDFAAFITLARKVAGVALVRARPFAGGTGTVEIDHARDPVDLARDLSQLKGLKLRLLSAGTGTIRLRSVD
jgi:hypothetical protein